MRIYGGPIGFVTYDDELGIDPYADDDNGDWDEIEVVQNAWLEWGDMVYDERRGT